MGLLERLLAPKRPQPELGWPQEVQFSLSAYCNLACVMCPREADWMPEGFTKLADEDRMVERFEKLGPILQRAFHLTLTGGGEPFLDPALFPILESADRYPNLNVSFNTNASVITPQRIDRAFSHRVAQLDISLDSPNAESFEAIRLGAKYDKVIAGIHEIVAARKRAEKKPRLSINMAVMKSNLHEIPEMVRLAAEAGVDGVCAIYAQLFRKDLMDQAINLAPRNHVQSVLEEAYREAERLGVHFSDLLAEPLGITLFDRPPWETRIGKLCRYPWDGLYVFANGNLRFCCFGGPVLGNIDRQSFEEVWSGPLAVEARRLIDADRFPDSCKSCYRWGPDKFEYQPETPGLEPALGPGRSAKVGFAQSHVPYSKA